MTKKPFRVIFSTFFEKVCFAASFFVLHGFRYKFFTGAAIFFYGHYNIMQIMLQGGILMAQIADVIKYEGDNSTFIWKHP